ncbi:hypothetical protein FHS29_001818 [Saccharothrix tamanrassetensis]|uniref:Subtilisin inhibitor domain-containing protein n=1 Tax=Saccharothrix tamanrassetensis TaxID=1051531 RepID=A0A841CGE5_9PSEU|nr:SSI family serine proteinase inhibitor [Saccharothrix tamanrassetensis]MBB5955248.1 hypothetical protein [Saccharothrix tamanrassetensis]
MAPLPLLAAIAALIPVFAVPESGFALSVTHRDSVRLMNLTCGPTGGSHPRAAEACDALSPVDGEISNLATETAVCTLEYDPVKVSATGTWRGETREFAAEFPNPCAMHADTGPVFDF